MAKRFTDTDKWNKAWIRRLSPKFKCAWFYLLDKCDHAGVWQEDFEAMSFNIGEEINQDEFEKVFSEKIQKVDSDKYFIKSFIDFQYGNLNPSNKVHKSVLERLEKIKPLTSPLIAPTEGAYEGAYKAPIEGAKDKDKEKDKAKDKEKEKEKEIDPSQVLNLWNEVFHEHEKIKAAPFFIPPAMLEDFKILSGFQGFQTIEEWREYFKTIKSTPHLCGDNPLGWVISFSWALKSGNAVKILDGSFQGKGQDKKPVKNNSPDAAKNHFQNLLDANPYRKQKTQ